MNNFQIMDTSLVRDSVKSRQAEVRRADRLSETHQVLHPLETVSEKTEFSDAFLDELTQELIEESSVDQEHFPDGELSDLANSGEQTFDQNTQQFSQQDPQHQALIQGFVDSPNETNQSSELAQTSPSDGTTSESISGAGVSVGAGNGVFTGNGVVTGNGVGTGAGMSALSSEKVPAGEALFTQISNAGLVDGEQKNPHRSGQSLQAAIDDRVMTPVEHSIFDEHALRDAVTLGDKFNSANTEPGWDSNEPYVLDANPFESEEDVQGIPGLFDVYSPNIVGVSPSVDPAVTYSSNETDVSIDDEAFAQLVDEVSITASDLEGAGSTIKLNLDAAFQGVELIITRSAGTETLTVNFLAAEQQGARLLAEHGKRIVHGVAGALSEKLQDKNIFVETLAYEEHEWANHELRVER